MIGKKLKRPLFGKLPNDIAPAFTVGELIHRLKKLPPNLPVASENGGREDGVKLICFNTDYRDVHLRIEENDGMWDEPDASEEDDDSEAA